MAKSFLYANGVVSAMYKNLITKESFTRMIDAQSAKEALSVLQETNFATGLTVNSPFEIEDLLNFESKRFLNFVKDESPVEALKQYFLLQNDFANISSFCKCLILGQEFDDFAVAEGNFEIAKIKDLISTKNFKSFNNAFIEKALNEFQDYASRSEIKGFEVDYIFKKYLYQNLKEDTKKDNLMSEIVSLKTDIENISVAVRTTTQFAFEYQKLQNATLSNEVLLKIFNKDKSVLSDIQNPILLKFAKLAVSENVEESFVKFEVLKNNFVFDVLLPKKFDIDSLAPFASFCFQWEAQIKNVRLIMSYQSNNLKDKIRERFLECYGGK